MLSLDCQPIPSKARHFVFGEPKRDLLIRLPSDTDEQLARRVDLFSVRRALWRHGLIKDEEEAFDSLFLIRKGDRLIWTDPETGRERRVTPAAGESDGLVVVRPNGSLASYPVDQAGRVKRAAIATGK